MIATTNDTKYMPPSLLRPGRFDYTLYLDPPMGKIAERIVSYYLRDKDLAEDVLISDIVKAMPKVSCATLETVMNLAALNSTYQGHEHIYKDDVTDALLQVVYKLSKTDKCLDLTECQKIALHEAAHAVVGEILNPDSIGIVTIRGNQSCIGGFENGCSTYLKNEKELLNDITNILAGKAGVSLIYGVMDVNASGDIQNANRLLDLWMTSLAGAGFSEVESANEIYDCSEELFIHRYQERYFNFAKQPQFQNFLSHYVNLANEYMEKRTQKEYNRANRSQWMGGGFGITGAIKGAAQAAVLNAATGVVRGIGDGISDFASSTAYKSKQNSLLSDDVFQEFDIALQNCIHGCILACQIEYSTHKGILCSWSQRENIEKSFAIFNNVQTRVTDTSKIAKLMSTAIELSPYNEEYYSFLYRQDGIDKTEVLNLAEYLGFSLYADRLELMDTALDALLDRLSSPAQYGECAKGIIALGQKYSLISSDDCIHATVKGDEAASFLIKSSFEFAIHGLYHEAMEQSRAGNNSVEQHRIYLQSLEELKKKYNYNSLSEVDPSAINEIQELENASDLRVAAEVQQQQYFLRAMRELRQFYRNESLSSKERITAILDFAERRHIPVTNGIAFSSSTPTIANAITMALAVEELNSRYADAGEQRRLSANRDLFVVFGHCMKGHNLSSLDFNDKSSEFLFVEIHCTLRQGSQIPFVVTSGQKSRPSKNIGSIPQRTIERQAKQLAFIIADQCDL